MAVSIRLKRMGTLKKPHFRIVVMDARKSPKSRNLEALGFYNPAKNPKQAEVDKERALHWLKQGEDPSGTVKSIFSRLDIVLKK